MKSFQVVDGAINANFSVYEIADDLFELIFPKGQNIEFDPDLLDRLSEQDIDAIFPEVWKHEIDKSNVNGIHGTIFYNDEYLALKKIYPDKYIAESTHTLVDGYKTIQMIDKRDLVVPIYQVSEAIFNSIFPINEDMAYEPELSKSMGKEQFDKLINDISKNPVNKTSIRSIDGTIYFGEGYYKSLLTYYPDKKFKI